MLNNVDSGTKHEILRIVYFLNLGYELLFLRHLLKAFFLIIVLKHLINKGTENLSRTLISQLLNLLHLF